MAQRRLVVYRDIKPNTTTIVTGQPLIFGPWRLNGAVTFGLCRTDQVHVLGPYRGGQAVGAGLCLSDGALEFDPR